MWSVQKAGSAETQLSSITPVCVCLLPEVAHIVHGCLDPNTRQESIITQFNKNNMI